MPEHPLLVFPEPARADRNKRQGFPSSFKVPGAQGSRLIGCIPNSSSCSRPWTEGVSNYRAIPLGIQPEQVLVLETVGSIDSFVNAIQRIDGLGVAW